MLLNFSEAFYENAEGVAFVRQMIRDNPHPQEPAAFRAAGRGVGAATTCASRLGALAMPVHVIAGEHDIVLPHWKSEELAAAIPGARLTVVPRAPHGAEHRARGGVQRRGARLHRRAQRGAGAGLERGAQPRQPLGDLRRRVRA